MISIILPTYNSITFLEKRISSIVGQTYSDWECIVIDGFSNDGTYEYLCQVEESDPRFVVFQFPAQGPYDAWNKGINKATGTYIYIATSDDTMSDNLFEEMLGAFQRHPECELAHCCLTLIDENDEPIENQWVNWEKVKFYGDFINIEHMRMAPHDGLVHAGWSTVYSSITQLLIKKCLFEKTGLFSTCYGDIADFEWGMKAGFVANVVHVPKYLATWRKHSKQLTNELFFQSPLFYWELIKMSKGVFKYLSKEKLVSPIFCFNRYYLCFIIKISIKQRNIVSFCKLLWFYPEVIDDVLKLLLKKEIISPYLHVKKLISIYGGSIKF